MSYQWRTTYRTTTLEPIIECQKWVVTPNEGVQVDPRTPKSSLKVFLKPGGARIALAEVTRDDKERPVLPPIRYLLQVTNRDREYHKQQIMYLGKGKGCKC